MCHGPAFAIIDGIPNGLFGLSEKSADVRFPWKLAHSDLQRRRQGARGRIQCPRDALRQQICESGGFDAICARNLSWARLVPYFPPAMRLLVTSAAGANAEAYGLRFPMASIAESAHRLAFRSPSSRVESCEEPCLPSSVPSWRFSAPAAFPNRAPPPARPPARSARPLPRSTNAPPSSLP